MFQSLLVPLDGSDFSERSLPLAHGIAAASGATLHLAHVHVHHEPEHFLSNTQFHYEGLDLNEYDERHRQRDREYLARVAERVDGKDAPTDIAVLEGNVAEELASYAEEVGANAIFMTTHGHKGVDRVRLGSVADELVRHTHLPLIVLHPGRHLEAAVEPATFRHIFVPLDGSDLAEAILEPAVHLAEATGARMTLSHVVTRQAVGGRRRFQRSPSDPSAALDAAEDYLCEIAGPLRSKGLEVQIHVEANEFVAPAIADAAEHLGADLIAIATHGYGGLKRALLGSVADKVLQSSPLPLLIQRP